MKELKRTETIEKVIGYEADDGTQFDSKEECEKYENSAFFVVFTRFKKLVVKEIIECDLFGNQGYGSEEYIYYLIDIKNKNDVDIYNQFLLFTDKSCATIDDAYIGKRILVGTGYEYDKWEHRHLYIKGTIDDLKKQFAEDMEKVFADKKGDTDETE